jgi:single-strand DNA-binding protein
LVGRLGKDPECRIAPGGTPLAQFSVATDEVWTDQSGQKQQRTEWHNVIAWGKLADICGDYLKKDRLVYVEGCLRTRTWQDKEGHQLSTTEIRADQMVMLGSGPAGSKGTAAKQPPGEAVDITDEDLPF